MFLYAGDHTSVFVTQEDLSKPEVVSSLVGCDSAQRRDQLGLSLSGRDATWPLWSGIQRLLLLLSLQV